MKRILPFLILPLLAACTASPQQSPTLCISPNGDTVAFFPHPNSETNHDVLFLNLATTKLTQIRLPHAAANTSLVWADDQLLILTPKRAYALNPHTAALATVPTIPYNPYPPFPANYQGQPALFATIFENNHFHTHITTPDSSSTLAILDFPVQGLGQGLMLHYSFPPDAPTNWTPVLATADIPTFPSLPITALNLLDSNTKPITHFSEAQFAEFGSHPVAIDASLSPDSHSLMLAQLRGPDFIVTAWTEDSVIPHYVGPIAIFEIPTGKLLYKVADPDRIVSPAFLANNALYAISEYPDPASHKPNAPQNLPHQYWLTCHTAAGSEKILLLPITSQPNSFETPLFSVAYRYYHSYNTAAPIIEFLLIHTANPDGSHLQLLKIPLIPKPTPADIQTIDLSHPTKSP